MLREEQALGTAQRLAAQRVTESPVSSMVAGKGREGKAKRPSSARWLEQALAEVQQAGALSDSGQESASQSQSQSSAEAGTESHSAPCQLYARVLHSTRLTSSMACAGRGSQPGDASSSEASTPRAQEFSIGARHGPGRRSPGRRRPLSPAPNVGKASGLLNKGCGP